MQTVNVSGLKAGDRFAAPIFGRDGEVLLLAYQEVDPVTLRALKESGLGILYLCESPEDAHLLRSRAQHEEVPVGALKPGERLSSNLYSADGRMILAAGQRLHQGHIDLFARRGISTLFRSFSSEDLSARRFKELLKQLTVESLLDQDERGALPVSRRGSPSIATLWARVRPNEREPQEVVEAQKKHIERLGTVFRALQILRVEGRLELPMLHDLARDIVEDAANDHLLLLAFAGNALHSEYLADHSLGVALFSVVIGALAGYSAENLLDIALGGLVHDIGMTTVPPEVVSKPGPLTEAERALLWRHPEEGFKILNELGGIDRHVHFMVFQSHERYEGQGYPRGRREKLIHEYARIVAIADTYQALVTPRPYHDRALPSKAMEKMLELTRQRFFDPVLVKLFFTGIGLFPVGSWVRLNTGFTARVVEPGGGDYTRPVVSIVFDREGKHLTRPILLDLASCQKTRIKEPVDDENVGVDMVAGFHSNGPMLPGLEKKASVDERWVVPGEVMEWSASFQGTLPEFRLLDVIQLLDLAQKNGLLIVKGPETEGRIYFDGGAMVRAETGAARDEEAVYKMLSLEKGSFSFVQKSVTVPRTVKMTNTSILLEALRRHDEKTRMEQR